MAENIPNLENTPFIQTLPSFVPSTDTSKLGGPLSAPVDNKPIVDKIRNVTVPTSLDLGMLKKDVDNDFWGKLGSNKKTFETPVKLNEAYAKVSDLEYVPRYDKFYTGVDNEELYAQNQGTISKWANGLTKNFAKAQLYLAGGVAGTFVGIGEAIKEGSLSAIWDNSFSDQIDEWGKRLDNSMANYVSEEEKNMSFLRSMGTSNFWANDFAGGLAFVYGAIGSELILSTVTGGSSLALATGKTALRGAGLVSKAATLGKSGLTFSNSAVKTLRAYNRTINTSKAVGALNNARFIATSAGFEAGVEARDAFNESVENFTEAYQNAYGRVPTVEEYEKFMPEAVNNSNGVFGANVAVVGASNFLQFGKMFGLSTGLSDNVGKALNKKLFGLGLTRAADGTMKAISPSMVQRIAGKSVAFLKNPIVEGWEEGTQSVISKTSKNLLAAKYDPSSLKDSYNAMDAVFQSLGETYGTKEGWKEVGIGMLIGKFSDVISKDSGLAGYNKQVKNNENIATSLNLSSAKLSEVTKTTIQRLLSVNQQMNASNKAAEASNQGLFTEASQYFDQAQFAKLLVDRHADTMDETLADFSLMISKMDDKMMAAEYGVAEDSVAEVKKALVSDYARNIEIFKKAYGASEALLPTVPGNKKRGLKEQHYVEEVASNFYLGVKAMDRASNLASSIESSTGITGFASMLTHYNNLDKDTRKNVSQLKYTYTRIKNLEQEYSQLQQEFSTLKETKPREGENTDNALKLQANRKKAANVMERQQKLSAEALVLKESIETNPSRKNYAFDNVFTKDTVFADELVRIDEELDKLEPFIENLSKADKQAADSLRYLVQEYSKNQASFEAFHDAYQRLTDKRFNINSYKGIANLFNTKDKYTKPSKNLSPLQQQVEEIIASNNMDDYEAFNFRLFSDISEQLYKGDFTEFTMEDVTDAIGAEEWNSFVNNGIVSDDTINSIAQKLENNQELTRRETRIKEQRETDINDKIKEIKKQKRNSLRAGIKKPTANENLIKTSDIIRDLINQILKSKNYLEGISVNDFTEADVPSEEDFREIHRLQTELGLKGRLSNKKDKRLEELKDKINKWGRIEGTLSGKYRLSDLYNQLFALEAITEQTTTDETDGVLVSEVLNADEIEAVGKKVYYNILQTYDKVFFSKDQDGIHIHNINLSGLLQIAMRDMNITSLKVDGKQQDPNLPDIKLTNFARVEYTDANGMSKVIAISRGSRGDLVLSEASIANLNKDSSIQVGVTLANAKMPTNYFTVLRKVIVDGINKLIPLDSNFSDPSISFDPQKVQQLRKNDELRMDVDMNDDYNKELLKEYKKTQDAETLAKNLKIRFIDAENNLAGVLKAEHQLDGLVANVSHFERMAEIRREAVNILLEDLKVKRFDLNSTVIVKNVFLGHPVLNIRTDASNKHYVVQNSFTEQTIKNISDIGYIENGVLKLHNNSDRNRLTETYVHSILKDKYGKYANKRVPVVVINYSGRNILYPVALKAEVVDNSSEVDNIIAMPISDTEKAIKINEVLMQNKIDVQPLNIRGDNFKSKVALAKSLLSSLNSYMDVADTVNPNIAMEDTLVNNLMIDLDLNGNLFHSPKVSLDFGPNTEIQAVELSEEEVEPEPEVVQPVEQIDENPIVEPQKNNLIVDPIERTEWKGYKVGDIIDGSNLDKLSGDLVGDKPGEKFILVQSDLSQFDDTREELLKEEKGYEQEESDRLDIMKADFINTPPLPDEGDGRHRIIAAKELGYKTILQWKNIKDVQGESNNSVVEPLNASEEVNIIERTEEKGYKVEGSIVSDSFIKTKVYHGSENKIVGDFKNINPNIDGFWFSSDIDNAKTYGNEVTEAYVDIRNPLVIDASGLKFTDDIPVTVIASYPNEKPYETTLPMPIDDIVYMVKNGKRPNQLVEIKDREKYDGVIFKNLIDPALSSRRNVPQDTIVVFNNSQIKREDISVPLDTYLTYDENGNEVIKPIEVIEMTQDTDGRVESMKVQFQDGSTKVIKNFSSTNKYPLGVNINEANTSSNTSVSEASASIELPDSVENKAKEEQDKKCN